MEGGAFGTKNMLVRSMKRPFHKFIKVRYANKTYPVNLVPYQRPQSRMDVMERAEHKQQQTVTPVQPRAWGHGMVGNKWAD